MPDARLTPEREAEIRRHAGWTAPGNAALTLAVLTDDVRELLAELDATRAERDAAYSHARAVQAALDRTGTERDAALASADAASAALAAVYPGACRLAEIAARWGRVER